MKSKSPKFSQYADDELKIVAALDRELAKSVFEIHRKGYDVQDILHEARMYKAEGEMMKRELQRRKRGK